MLFIAAAVALVALTAWWQLRHFNRRGRWLGAVMLALLTAGLYQWIGTPAALDPLALQPAEPDADISDAEIGMEQAIAALRTRLQAQPENLEGWMLLGRSEKQMGRFEDSVNSFTRALTLAPDNATVMAELAESRIYANRNPSIDAASAALLQDALSRDPQQQKALFLAGIAAAQRGEREQAADYWQDLLAQLPPGSDIHKAVSEQLTAVRPGATTGMASATPPPQPPAGDTSTSVSARISLAENIDIPSGAAVFVIARVPGERGPPFAAKRVSVDRLPLEVEISDADRMVDRRSLASLEALSLQARLAAGGTVQSSAGDWVSETVVAPVAGGDVIDLLIEQPLSQGEADDA